jgi:hypothetical protein
MSGRIFLIASLALAVAPPVFGQGLGAAANLIDVDGKIEMIGSGRVTMHSSKGQAVMVIARQDTKVEFTGTASTDFVTPGVAIEFTADVDKKHNIKDKITEVTVITLGGDRPAGLSAPGSGDTGTGAAKSGDADNFAFGGNSGNAVKGGDTPPEKGSARKAPRKPQAVQLPGTCLVRGTVKSLKAGKLIVNIGHGIVRADLADDAQVSVNMGDLSKARRGDAIAVKGTQLMGGQQLMVQATFVSVQASEPLQGPKKKPAPAAKKRASSKKDQGDDSGDSKPAKKAADE